MATGIGPYSSGAAYSTAINKYNQGYDNFNCYGNQLRYSKPIPQVLGASTSGGGGGSPAPSGGGDSGGGNPNPQPSQPSWEDQMRASIENTYNNYNSYLDQIYQGLNPQAEAQRGTVRNQYQQGMNTYGSQLTQGKADLASTREDTLKNQETTFKQLADAMRNQFMSGQVMLGSRGAGDSSAVNQYSYALTKLGNQQRGDVATNTANIIDNINDREFKLQNTYDTETQNIALERDNQLNSISQWLAEQQNAIRQLQAEGQLRKGQDMQSLAMNAYNQAIARANQANEIAANKSSMLQQWALNNASNIQQMKANMGAISQYTPNMPAFQGLNASLGFNQQATPAFYIPGSSTREDERMA